jgi:hypothetical protein
MLDAIAKELRTGVIRRIPREQVKWEHPSHLIPKKNGKLRKLMNGTVFNKYILKTKFKLEDQRLLLQLLQRNMFATSVDITSAYHHVPVASWAQLYLCFNYDKQDVLLSSNAVRPVHSTLRLHPVDAAVHQSHKTAMEGDSSPLLGRPPLPTPRPRIFEESNGRDRTFPRSDRLGGESGEERDGTEAAVRFLGWEWTPVPYRGVCRRTKSSRCYTI